MNGAHTYSWHTYTYVNKYTLGIHTCRCMDRNWLVDTQMAVSDTHMLYSNAHKYTSHTQW